MKYLLPGLISLLYVACFGQSKKFTFKLGQEYELPRKSEDLSFFGNNKDGLINLSLNKDELNIFRFSPKNLGQTSDKQIELTEKTRNFNTESVVDLGTNYYWLHSDWDKSAQQEMLYYEKIDAAKGNISESNKLMFQTTKIAGVKVSKGFFENFSYKTENKYFYNFDVSHKHLLVSYRLWPEEKNDKKNYDKLGFQVFDENMKKIWGGEFKMPYTEQIMDNSDYSIDSLGNAYLLAKVYDSEKRKEKDKETGAPGYHYEIMKFTSDGKMTIAIVKLDNFFIREASLIENSRHEMLVASTYSKKSSHAGTDGIFLSLLNSSGELINYKTGYYEFPLEELTKFETARAKRRMEKKDDYEAPSIRVRDIIVSEDGSVFIACEEFYVEVVYRTSTGAGGFGPGGFGTGGSSNTVSYNYHYNDILAAKINAAGQFEWLRKIPKKQIGSTDEYYVKSHSKPYRGTLGFKLIADESCYYFLYLDNKKNLELAEDEEPRLHMDGLGGQVMVSKIDLKGQVTKEILFDTREEDVMLFPADFTQINNNQFIGRAKLKRNIFEPLLITVN